MILINYLKISKRNFFNNKLVAFINLVSLSIGIGACILISLWIYDELSFDRFNIHSKDIFRVLIQDSFNGDELYSAVTSPPLGTWIKNKIPDISNSSRFSEINTTLKNNEGKKEEFKLHLVDPEFLEMFSLNFVLGDPITALNDLNSLIIVESVAKQIFGDENPIGKAINVGDVFDLKITGVIKDIRQNSSVQFKLLSRFDLLEKMGLSMDNWNYNEFSTFIMAKEGSDRLVIAEKINSNIKNEFTELKQKYSLQALTEIHLYSADIKYDPMVHGSKAYVNIFIVAALVILCIACINFINLYTAASFTRIREIAIRKVVGAKVSDIFSQFMFESTLVFVVSSIIALVVVLILLPVYNDFVGKDLDLLSLTNWPIFAAIAGIALIACFVSTFYPITLLSKYNGSNILQKKYLARSTNRKFLIVLQFVLSSFFMIAMITISKQYNYIQTKNLGFEKENLIYVPFNNQKNTLSTYDMMKNKLLENPNVLGVTMANNLLTGLYSGVKIEKWEEQNHNEEIKVFLCTVGYDFVSTMQMKMIEGRDFNVENASDVKSAVILNRKAAEFMFESPIGKTVSFSGDREVVGVVEDFNFKSLYQDVEPMIIMIDPVCRYMFIRISSENIANTLTFIGNSWKTNLPGQPLSFNFLDDVINDQYKSVQQLGMIINYFALLSIVISNLGLFGLLFYFVEKRRKEIGIRKVNGAKIWEVMGLLNMDFVKWVVIAFVIATPIAWYAMDKWLQNFAYKTEMSWWIFALAGALALGIALLTVSWQSWKAATRNPVEALRYE